VKLWRHYLVAGLFLVACVGIGARVVFLTVTEREFLQEQGNARSLRIETIPAYRGIIYDREHEALALSTPVASVWSDEKRVNWSAETTRQIAKILELDVQALAQQQLSAGTAKFRYLKRRAPWAQVQALKALAVPGLQFDPEYKRYYPASETAAHVVGITGIDDLGLEGVELAFDDRLRGRPGRKRVLKDRRGDTIENLAYLEEARGGQDLQLSLDLRLQFFAYRELKAAVAGHEAVAASVVMLDARTGEILALVNQPSYNPNEVQTKDYTGKRNLAVTDTYEPGSTVKPFTVLAALESGDYDSTTPIDTAPGYLRVGRKLVEDPVNRGTITLQQVLQKSSQVGIAKIALALPDRAVYDVLSRAGMGEFIGTGLPGEVVGSLTDANIQNPVVRATLAYGYGLAVSPLQLASAYLTLASGGKRIPLSILRRDGEPPATQTFKAAHTRAVLAMLETVTADAGTAPKARVANFRVAGKTGTARKLSNGKYDDKRHVALFAGIAPVNNPRIVMVVVVDEPKSSDVGGGGVAAPIFSRIAARSLRLLGVAPDAPVAKLPVPLVDDGGAA
jgi:cell division protein FtsI (penicillin-binding protein 3)